MAARRLQAGDKVFVLSASVPASPFTIHRFPLILQISKSVIVRSNS